MLLLFVAAPLRRSGAYTIPDFTEARLDSRVVRSVTSVVVVMVGWLYIRSDAVALRRGAAAPLRRLHNSRLHRSAARLPGGAQRHERRRRNGRVAVYQI